MRFTERKSVDFPQPEGPMSAVTLPRGTESVIECSARDLPYHRSKRSISSTWDSPASEACTSAGNGSFFEMASNTWPEIAGA